MKQCKSIPSKERREIYAKGHLKHDFFQVIKDYRSDDKLKREEATKIIENAAKKTKRNYYFLMEDYHFGTPEQKQMAVQIMCEDLTIWIHDIIHRHYSSYELNHKSDLVQIGYLAILKKISEYNPEKTPVTYFTFYIQGDMWDYISHNVNNVRRYIQTTANQIDEAIKTLLDQNIEPSIENIVRITGNRITREVIYNNIKTINRTEDTVYLDEPTPDSENGYSPLDSLVQNEHTPEEAYVETEQKDVIAKALAKLTEEERAVLDSLIKDENTIKDTSEILQIPVSKVKKIRTSAYLKLQNCPILKNYMGIFDNNELAIEVSFKDDDVDMSDIDYMEIEI